MSATWGYDDARRAACVAAFGDWHSADFWKHNDDLRRYDQIIRNTLPDIVIETGTNTGASASWLSTATPAGRTVVTVDVDCKRWDRASGYGIARVIADSADPLTARRIAAWVERWPGMTRPRVMVSLDSDHSAAHVRREIELYAPMVTPGCYLVVEDGILAWLGEDQLKAHDCRYDGTPLDAIADWSAAAEGPDVSAGPWNFERDTRIEFAYPVTMSPAGWWRRNG
jgi:cephalosporin hydroxylase